jgi:hypothetical protein
VLDTDVLVLRTGRIEGGYEVDLEQCLDSAQVLDWIFQAAGKTWGDDRTITGLVNALDDVLDPQAALCSWGKGKTITKAQAREMALAAQARQERGIAVYGQWWEAATAP